VDFNGRNPKSAPAAQVNSNGHNLKPAPAAQVDFDRI
jgi:hypothetical protein